MQHDRGEPVSERWMIINHEKGREMGVWMFMEKSADKGRTWEPVDLTAQFFAYPGAGLARILDTAGSGHMSQVMRSEHGPPRGARSHDRRSRRCA